MSEFTEPAASELLVHPVRRWMVEAPMSICSPKEPASDTRPSTPCRLPGRPEQDRCSPEAGVVDESACRPGSVSPRERGVAAIHLGLPLPAASSGLPAGSGRLPSGACAGPLSRALLDLAPGGVYRAAPVTWSAGGLLHHRFTLTPANASRRRSDLCGTVPRITPGRRYRPPCRVEPGPSSSKAPKSLAATARPTRPPDDQPTARATGPATSRVSLAYG
jgi:hypothetical protein